MRVKMAAKAAASAFVLSLVACGGGGGGTSGGSAGSPASPPAPPPPPANTAPEVRYTPSSTTPDEGQPFWIDANGSTDADGDALTITITQTAGPEPSPVPLDETDAPSGEGLFAFRAPELDEDAVMQFEISVSDGEHTVTETASVTVQNIVLGPEVNVFGDTLATFSSLINPTGADFYSELDSLDGVDDILEDYAQGIMGVGEAQDSSGQIVFRFPFDYLGQVFGTVEQSIVRGSSPGQSAHMTMLHMDTVWGTPRVVVPMLAAERLNKLSVVGRDKNKIVSVYQGLDIQAPCAVENVFAYDQFKRPLVVGKRGHGLQIFDQLPLDSPTTASNTYQPGEVLTDTGTFCTVSTSPNSIAAYESETSTIRRWARTGDTFEELASIPIDLPENALALVGVDLLQNDTNRFVLGLVMSDGAHDGHHELHIYYNDFTGTLPVRHKSFSWDKGVPAEIEYTQTNSDVWGPYPAGFFVPLETAPYAIFVRQGGSSVTGDEYPLFDDIGYVPTGLWVTSIRSSLALDLLDLASGAAVITKTRTGEVIMKEFPR